MPSYARRTDKQQKSIVAALRKRGCWVDVTSGVGAGFPDLVVSNSQGFVFLVEIKEPKGKLKPDQVQYIISRVIDAYRIFDTEQKAVEAIAPLNPPQKTPPPKGFKNEASTWYRLRKNEMMKMWRNKYTLSEIAEKWDLSEARVKALLRRWGVVFPRGKS